MMVWVCCLYFVIWQEPDPKKNHLVNGYHRLKAYSIFYKNGVKQCYDNITRAYKIRKKTDWSRRDYISIFRHSSDLKKLPLISILAMLIPELIVVYTSQNPPKKNTKKSLHHT